MGLGFGIFILAVAVLFVFTRATLTQSSELAEEVDEALVPSLEALEDMGQNVGGIPSLHQPLAERPKSGRR